MTLALQRIDTVLKSVNSGLRHNVFIERTQGKSTLYYCDNQGIILLTLSFPSDLAKEEMYNILNVLSNTFI